jgi:hypothetical protein
VGCRIAQGLNVVRVSVANYVRCSQNRVRNLLLNSFEDEAHALASFQPLGYSVKP